MLKHTEFKLLSYFAQNAQAKETQRSLSKRFDISLGSVNNALNKLINAGLVSLSKEGTYTVTAAGYTALKPYKVKNAIIMAAGMSNRFVPLSYEKPKGLLKVKGEILIEREIEQLKQAGINDITIVVGYMKEKFFYLADKYGVKILVNEDYYRYNNTSTLLLVLDQLSNTYICSSDNYFVENVFEPYVYEGYYSAVYMAGPTDEYCLQCDSRGKIKGVTFGGHDSWYMSGHVYFDHAFSEKFSKILREEFANPDTQNNLWENLYARYVKELILHIRKYDRSMVWEFDSLEELREFDSEYIDNADSHIFKNICKVLNCSSRDITGIEAIKAGLTNTSFKFTVHGKAYVYRHPGRGTEKYINRKSEAFSMGIASELGLDKTFVYMDEREGWKISKYIKNARDLDYHNPTEVTQALSMMKKLHAKKIVSKYDFDIWAKTKDFIRLLKDCGKADFSEFDQLYDQMKQVHKTVTADKYSAKILCHCDCYAPNFMLDNKNRMYLIDWEYSGNDDPASDLGTFICCSDYTYEEALNIITQYLGRKAAKTELKHYLGYIAEASYYWYVWALYQETRGNHVGNWLLMWYNNTKQYIKKVLSPELTAQS